MIKYINMFENKVLLSLMIATVIITACNHSNNTSADTSEENVTDTSAISHNWVPLFNGKTLEGWHTYGGESVGKAWKAEDSVLHLQPASKQGWKSTDGGDVVTDKEYSNFDLKLEWKISDGGNSGILFYVHEDPSKHKDANESGLEMQVNDDEKNENGKVEKHRAGDLYNLISSSSSKVLKPAGQWNQAEIRSNKGKLDFFMNGQHTLSATLWDEKWEDLIDNSKFENMDGYGTYKKGRIALQDHGQDVWFRNIMIRKL